MIEIKNLTKTFPGNVIAVNNLSLDIKEGITGLIGENGAGKSTLLRLIADVYKKDSGEILIDSMDNALDDARKIKPEIPLNGMDGIPLKHEIELEYIL